MGAINPEQSVFAKPPHEPATPGWGETVLSLILHPFLPMGLRQAVAIKQAWPRLRRGFMGLLRGIFDVDLLDATAIAICIWRRDFRSLTSSHPVAWPG
ncbi:MAG: hypothetical protein U5J62_07045 [Desulfurivibrio sp.]|nr:hypothetical protein [Desulfurivibrio sp.]